MEKRSGVSPNMCWFYLLFLLTLSWSLLGNAAIIVYDEEFEIEEFSNYELSFTKPVNKKGLEGVVVAADPPHACTNISGPPENNTSLNWFVLISGNVCDYETKVIYSKIAGYSAAVIYTYRGVEDSSMKYNVDQDSTYYNISAVVVRTITGLRIKERYLYTIDKRYRILIFSNNNFNIMTFLLLFAIVAGLFIAIMLAFTIIRFVQQAQSPPESRLSSWHLRRLQTSWYQKGDPYETCAICLEDYKDKDKLRILPCYHGYHTHCIDPWLTQNRRICPVCKQKVVLTGEFSGNVIGPASERVETTPLLSNISTRNITEHGTFASSNVVCVPFVGLPSNASETVSDIATDTNESANCDTNTSNSQLHVASI